MKYCEITYKYKGESHVTIVRECDTWASEYYRNVLNAIEQLVNAGAVITDVMRAAS